jgi:hypothetical protein
MKQDDLFGAPPPPPHKTQVRERLLALQRGTEITYEGAYARCRDIRNRPVNWQANIRDELHRLWQGGYFTRSDPPRTVYTRTDKN